MKRSALALALTLAVLARAIYPPKAAAAGETWGRLPNADPAGQFAITTPTPGAPNLAR